MLIYQMYVNLSDKNADLSDNHVDLQDLYVDLSDNFGVIVC